MHTATRIARTAIGAVRAARPDVPVCCYGLYAQMAADVADCVLAGETTAALADWVEGRAEPGAAVVRLGREAAAPGAPVPARDLLPPLDRYAHLLVAGVHGDEQRLPVGYVEASHGCAHRCRHCPVPVVYDGRIRIVDADAVIADVAQQVDAGARHITFGDPDFLNGVHHSLRVVRAMHARFPDITFDCTVKVEHVLAHAEIWPELAASGCRFVVSAFEAVERRHPGPPRQGPHDGRRGPGRRAAAGERHRGPAVVHAVHAVDDARRRPRAARLRRRARPRRERRPRPVHDPAARSRRARSSSSSPTCAALVGPYDPARGSYEWAAPDPALDELQTRLAAIVEEHVARGTPIPETYAAVCTAAGAPGTGSAPRRCAAGPASASRGSAARNRPRSRSRSRRTQHVERGAGAEPRDVLVGHGVGRVERCRSTRRSGAAPR